MKAKLEVVTGFLGSGKTAFINALIDETIVKGEKVLVIQLEDGQTNVKKSFGSIEVCKYFDDIYNINQFLISRLAGTRYDKVFIEFNGTENFDELLNALNDKVIKKYASISTIYFVADVKNIKSYVLNMSDLIIPSIEQSNLLLLNNCKDVDDEKIDEAVSLLKQINLSGHILTCEKNESMGRVINKSRLFSRKRLKRLYANFRGNN